MHDVTIRVATAGDVAAITTLAGELGYPSTVAEMGPRLDVLLALETETVLVANRANEVVGWIQVGITHALESGSFAEIRGLVVSESQRSRGVGALLVKAAEEWASGRAMSRMRVRSNILRERTHTFYERLGYQSKKSQKAFEKRLTG
jgi:N-acetylglutamate synthase-like GNAT family acetyltransferase